MYKCPYCPAWFKKKKGMNMHIGKQHKPETNNIRNVSADPIEQIRRILDRRC